MIKPGAKIHTRTIDIAIYEGTSDSMVVEGVLRDERLFESYRFTGNKLAPGAIHHMIIRMEVKGPRLVIENIEVDMPTVPLEACSETLKCLEPIKGLAILSGFKAKAKDLVGGTRGCHHLLGLLSAMAAAAVQGAWSAMARKPIDPKIQMPMVLKRVKNTCRVWREDGPLMQEWSKKASEG